MVERWSPTPNVEGSSPSGRAIMSNKAIVITGASQGIGLALSENLVKQDFKVIGLARNFSDNYPGIGIKVDLSDIDATSEAISEIQRNYGPITHIVNNVGIVKPAAIEEIKLEDFAQVLDLNCRPAIQILQAFLPDMKKAKFGRVVNISSLAILGIKDRTSYSAAKAALDSFSRSWALELAADGITVNTVAPALTRTKLFEHAYKNNPEKEAELIKSIPVGRIAEPEDICSSIEFFLSEKSSFITGQTLFVDGGRALIA